MGISSAFTAVTEDFTRVNGLVAGCGQAALLAVLHVTKGLPATPDELKTLIVQGINNNQAGAGGVSSPANLIWLAKQYGQDVQPIDFSQLDQYVGKEPVILGVNNASVFGGYDTSVHGHYVTVLDKSGRNYVVSDPNSAESQSGQFSLYTPDQLASSNPFWTAVIPVSSNLQTNTLAATTPTSLNPFDALKPVGDFFAQLGGLLAWVGKPMRIIKLFFGWGLLAGALIMGFAESSRQNPAGLLQTLSLADMA